MGAVNHTQTYKAADSANPNSTIGAARIVRLVPSGASEGKVERTTLASQVPLGVAKSCEDELGGTVGVIQAGLADVEFGGAVAPGGAVMSDADGKAVAAVGPCWVLGFYCGKVAAKAGQTAHIELDRFYIADAGSV